MNKRNRRLVCLLCQCLIHRTLVSLKIQGIIHRTLVSLKIQGIIHNLLANYIPCAHAQLLSHFQQSRAYPATAILRIKHIDALRNNKFPKVLIRASYGCKIIHLGTDSLSWHSIKTCHAHIRSTIKQFKLLNDASYQLIPVAIPLGIHAPSSPVRIPVMRPTINLNIVASHTTIRELLVHLIDAAELTLIVRTCFVYIISHINQISDNCLYFSASSASFLLTRKMEMARYTISFFPSSLRGRISLPSSTF